MVYTDGGGFMFTSAIEPIAGYVTLFWDRLRVFGFELFLKHVHFNYKIQINKSITQSLALISVINRLYFVVEGY